jgi:hypothetical protein
VAMRISPPAGKGELNSEEVRGKAREPSHAASSSLPSIASGPEIDGIITNAGSAANDADAIRYRTPRYKRLDLIAANLPRWNMPLNQSE